MPGLVRKLLILATVEGLLLQPIGTSTGNGVVIKYGGENTIRSTHRSSLGGDDQALESNGIIGILNLVTQSYLISISRKLEVAQIRGSPIYEVKDITLIPLASQTEAHDAISRRLAALKLERGPAHAAYESDGGYATDESLGDHADQPPETAALELPPRAAIAKRASVLQSVVQDKGKYGRFAERWFSKGGWTTTERRRLGMTDEQADKTSHVSSDSLSSTTAPNHSPLEEDRIVKSPQSGPSAESSIVALTPRIVRATHLYFSSGGFYFSYDHDISRSLAAEESKTTSVPLYKRFQPRYFWNYHLLQNFVAAKEDRFILPLVQGFVGQRSFTVERADSTIEQATTEQTSAPTSPADQLDNQGQKFLLTLISRRSIERTGLRYLRRGVDDQGNVANNVETEQILSPVSESAIYPTHSLLQIRGSIPLFFSQSPYSFKPIPVQFGSTESNDAAMSKHFDAIKKRYGPVQIISLVDKHGTEASIGKSYEDHISKLQTAAGVDKADVKFEWFDFHSVCKGMNFGKVQTLLDTLQSELQQIGFTIEGQGRYKRRQNGVLRVNCMDCLDRTNVVQSAVGGWALQSQLTEMGFKIDLQNDSNTRWFNALWADNGDNISKQYAGTAALKGDFTRTRERKWTGALSDFSLTLTRYYNNIFGDYFLQTCIDYYLGKTTASSFDDFEADMVTQDLTLDVGRIRQNAIDRSVKMVLESPDEHLVAAQVLASPHQSNTLNSLPFEECVVLLTDTALYHVRFDWDVEKVSGFERIDLSNVRRLWHGAYITNTMAAVHTNPSRNYGFVVSYVPVSGLVRKNTRSLGNEKTAVTEKENENENEKTNVPTDMYGGKDDQPRRILAFKALPARSTVVERDDAQHKGGVINEVDSIKAICNDISRTIKAMNGVSKEGEDRKESAPSKHAFEALEKDVISLADAKKSTGYIESLGYSIKKLVWS